jgi:hypothetical protein
MTTPAPNPAAHAAAQRSTIASDLRAVMHHRLGHALGLACAAACVWFFAVRPIERAHAVRLDERDALEARMARHQQSAPAGPSAREQAAQLDRLLNDVQAWSEPSHDQRGLYDGLTRLAAENGVRLERIDPTSGQNIAPVASAAATTAQPRSRRSRAAAATPQASWSGRTVGHRLSITGTYQQISDFIASCETDLGATKVVAFRVTSEAAREGQPGVVEATLETVHLALIPPPPQARSEASPADAEGGTR